MKSRAFLLISVFVVYGSLFGQSMTRSKEGRPILNRSDLINDCVSSLNKNRSDQTAIKICQCQVDKLDGRFTNKQFKQHTKSRIVDLTSLIKEDSIVEAEIQACYTSSGQTILLQAEGFEAEFLEQCKKSIQSSSDKTLDAGRVKSFCQCQLELVKSKRLSDMEMSTISNPNSLLFFQMMYKCGDPFTQKSDAQRNWTPTVAADVQGPAADTVNVLTLNGMSYVKVKIGTLVQVWLFDTGATDLLINTETEEALRKENILADSNYLGIGEYEMANGTIDSCRRYRINSVQIGNYSVNNIIVSVSEKGKRIIIGKTLLNKFRSWSLSNQENKLYLLK